MAQRLDDAWECRTPVLPFSDTEGLTTVADAYAVQARWTELRLERGDTILGRKIGLTSPAMQDQMGVNEPDFGTLWGSRFFPATGGRARLACARFLQPKLEGEFAFLIGESLNRDDVTPQLALAITEAIAPAFELVDSRIKDWRIKLADTIADNASYGGYVLGAWDPTLCHTDLHTLGMRIHRNGEAVAEGIGAAALGGPARAVAWLLSRMGALGVGVEAGDVVLSGSLTRAIDVRPGDVFVLQVHDQEPLSVLFD